MSTTDREPLGSVTNWFRTLFGRFIAGILFFGILVTTASSPALLALPQVGDLAASFGWLAIVGFILPMFNLDLDEDESETLASITAQIEDANRVELILYAMSFLLVLVCMVSTLVSVIGIAASFIVGWTNIGLIGIVLALFYPSVDIWLGNRVGINIATIGALLAFVILYIAVLAHRSNTQIPQTAANDARSFLLSY
jgi:hypothetical protein